ncbi:response regulator transcription factor [Cohnella sp. JJ-181]|uniref:response regulator transcription factor n=1 Tax=Cohnella rhizoplanae TaxID=2974897 RepID=UPI0022FFA550|nr:response regulator [Cohnella sp. JJ-181]CAI6083743.1 HTH-type transcriptional activator RhaR [Cohnella sp. JJ-181]
MSMHTVIIADDEQWIVEGIKAAVGWAKYGFEVVGDAEDGQAALDLIEALRPTLVFTDIKMPVMNGLELIQQGKAVSPDTLFVVLSGHAEFAYAQKAINYGTFGYCLKPFEIDEIHGMLARIAQHLASSAKKTASSHSYELYEAVCAGDLDRVGLFLDRKGMPVSPRTPVVPVVVQGPHAPPAAGGASFLSFPMSRRRHGYLMEDRRKAAFLQGLSGGSRPIECGVGVGPALTDVRELDAALEAASLAAYGMFATGQPGVYPAAPPVERPIEDKLREIAQTLERKDRLGFISAMDSTKERFRNGSFTIKEAYVLYTSVLYLFPREGPKPGGRFFEGYEQLYYRYGTAEAMVDDLVTMTLESLTEGIEAVESRISHKKVKEIVLYIRNRFNQELSIQSLSEQFYLSPNYLCQLFKKEVGETIVEHISRQRIEYACKLLEETGLSIYQVGEKCGFHDYFYFTRIFKRYRKMTPTQYRERA